MSLLRCDPASIDLAAVQASFEADGFARLGTLASDDTLAALRLRCEDLMLGRITYPGLFFQIDTESGNYSDLTYGEGWKGPSLNYRKLEKLELDPLFLAWINNPAFERVVRSLIEGPISMYRATLFSKRARGGTVLPFHQDAGAFWGLDRDPFVQLWTALDDAPAEAGAMEAVPGSHRWGLATPLGGLVPPDIVARADVEGRLVSLPARAGEVILLHNNLWHRSGVNRTDHPRRGLTVCYMTAATRCRRKRRAPREFLRVFEASR